MSVSANYSQPVQVNGFTCHNCTDVDYAKKHIDPAHPKSGPYGVDAASDPTVKDKPASARAVTFGGALAALNGMSSSRSAAAARPPGAVAGLNLDISA